ncbi:MAG: hypothetical protein HY904_05645 [Deltaproteobacteria bacterium]|nr:hypothetical protein [Deltaproteobacteria bacterium]
MKWFTVVAMTVLGGQGCAALALNGTYQPRTAALAEADPATLYEAVEHHARAENWQVVRADPAHGTLEALTGEQNDGEFAQRERWLFTVRGGAVQVRMIYEVRFAPGQDWTSTDEICDGYTYAREDGQLRAVSVYARSLLARRDSLETHRFAAR